MIGTLRHRVVVNPVSGNGRGRRIGKMLPEIFARLGLAAEFHVSSTAQHFSELVRSHRSEEGQRVVICGGDGSLNMALDSMEPGRGPPLALVPCGRGNDIARSLGIPQAPEAAAGLLVEGSEGPMDVGYVGERPFASIAAMGFDSFVTMAASRMRRVRGRLVYVVAALKELARFTPPEFSIVSDTFRFRGRAMMVSVANAPYYGGGMRLSPTSVMDDGLMEICVVLPMSKLNLLRLLPRVFSGGHVDSPLFMTAPVRRARIASTPRVPVCADGEYLASSPVDIRVERGAARIVSPCANSGRAPQ